MQQTGAGTRPRGARRAALRDALRLVSSRGSRARGGRDRSSTPRGAAARVKRHALAPAFATRRAAVADPRAPLPPGTQTFDEFLEGWRSRGLAGTPCTSVWTVGAIAYRCRTCQARGLATQGAQGSCRARATRLCAFSHATAVPSGAPSLPFRARLRRTAGF
jgi:hypothetical protein